MTDRACALLPVRRDEPARVPARSRAALPRRRSSVRSPSSRIGAGPFSDYRALVCVFLFGGNDAHNMIVPLDARYATYATNRGPLALPRASLTRTRSATRCRGLRLPPADDAGRASCSAPEGSRSSRTSARCCARRPSSIQNGTRCRRSSSRTTTCRPLVHCHPQAPATTGWGGRLADLLQSANTGQLSVSIATAAPTSSSRGRRPSRYQIGTYKPPARRSSARSARTVTSIPGGQCAGHLRERDHDGPLQPARGPVRRHRRPTSCRTTLRPGRASTTGPTPAASTPRGFRSAPRSRRTSRWPTQLRSVAMMIAARQALGVKRQIFFVSLGGFDTHSDQFDAALQHAEAGPQRPGDPVRQARRTARQARRGAEGVLRRNGRAGRCEQRHDVHRVGLRPHADVQRQGLRPRLGRAPPRDGRRGEGRQDLRHVPQHAGRHRQSGRRRARAPHSRLFRSTSTPATMARWMGASSADLNVVFPNLANFNQVDLGFMA